jgi:hypothetical protein
MKRTNILYWIFSILFGGLMLFSGIPNLLLNQESVDFIGRLGYPTYFIRFIGLAKILGVIAILVPGYPKIKEWAYAGLFYDLIAALYSLIAIGDPIGPSMFLLLPIALGALSYFFYHRKLSNNKVPLPNNPMK